jgi:integrase
MASITRRRGSDIWTAFFRDETGRQHCRSTETTDRKLAQKLADQFEAGAQKKRTLRQLQCVLAQMHELVNGEALSRVSVRAFVSEWLELRKPENAPSTFDFYQDSAKKLMSFLGERADAPLSGVTKRDLTAYRNTLAKNLAPKTVNHHTKFVKMLFKAARRDEIIAENPAEFVEGVRSQHSQGNRRAFTLPEISAILSVADPEWRSMILFGLYTGQRLGDIASLEWSNIDLERLQIRFITSKTGRTMILPLAPALAKHVLSLATADNSETPLHPRAYAIVKRECRSSSLSNQFSDLMAEAGLRQKKTHHKLLAGRSARRHSTGLSFHSFRHTATSLLHEAGIPAAVAQAFVGHDSQAIHAHYTHVGTESLRRAANALPELFPGDGSSDGQAQKEHSGSAGVQL